MGGTPQCIEDTRRGVYSYEALRSRLAEGRFGREGVKDMLAPVIHLTPLTNEEMLVLIEKLTDIHAQLFGYAPTLTQEDMVQFIQNSGASAQTPTSPHERSSVTSSSCWTSYTRIRSCRWLSCSSPAASPTPIPRQTARRRLRRNLQSSISRACLKNPYICQNAPNIFA